MTQTPEKTLNTRYPYTYAADYLRSKIAKETDIHGLNVPILSRADAAFIQHIIADALGIEKDTISKALADKYIEENSDD